MTEIAATKTMTVGLDKIRPNPDQPRKLFDQAALQELADSIRELGLLQPPVVRPDGDGGYVLVMGERRWRACQTIDGLSKIKVIVSAEPDHGRAFLQAIAENVNRADMTLMEEARAYQTCRANGLDVEEIGQKLGKRPEHIRARLDLLNLVPDVQDLVEQKIVRADLAWYIARLDSTSNQQHLAGRYVRGDFPTETDAVEYARALRARELQPPMFGDAAEDEPAAVEQRQRVRRTVLTQLDAVARLADVLGQLADADPAELASALGGKTGVYQERLAAVAKLASRARGTMTKARALERLAGTADEAQEGAV
jgi:ParB family transcriptional regulator, chromosome partitioning protein